MRQLSLLATGILFAQTAFSGIDFGALQKIGKLESSNPSVRSTCKIMGENNNVVATLDGQRASQPGTAEAAVAVVKTMVEAGICKLQQSTCLVVGRGQSAQLAIEGRYATGLITLLEVTRAKGQLQKLGVCQEEENQNNKCGITANSNGYIQLTFNSAPASAYVGGKMTKTVSQQVTDDDQDLNEYQLQNGGPRKTTTKYVDVKVDAEGIKMEQLVETLKTLENEKACAVTSVECGVVARDGKLYLSVDSRQLNEPAENAVEAGRKLHSLRSAGVCR